VVSTVVALVVAAATLVEAALAVPVSEAADFAQPRIRMGPLILPVEVSADQPVRSNTTTEPAGRLLLGHTNSADRGTNRRNRMPAGTQPLLASRIDRNH
jgi:hypothetical protein